MSVKCSICQFENTSDSKFCKECGTQILSPKDIEVTETMEAPKEELTRGGVPYFDVKDKNDEMNRMIEDIIQELTRDFRPSKRRIN